MRLHFTAKSKDAAVELLSLYGLKAALARDGRGEYFDVTIPDYWGRKRRAIFRTAFKDIDSKSRH